jgi:NAD(P)-dependent dehydrogenase (short-subunit alcohol dehydrogenase family)
LYLKDKTAVVTGAKIGIGKAIAVHLAKQGANIIACSRTLSPDDAVISECISNGSKAMAVAADVAAMKDCIRLVEKGLDHFGRIDILVNNAGIYPSAPLLEIDEQTWDRVFAVNLKGTLFAAQTVAKLAMIPQKSGRIINISSCDGRRPTAGIAHYAASKAGVISLTKSIALELAPYNITANAVAPGWVETDAIMKSDRWKTAVKEIPLGRLARPEEIANVVAFLADDNAGYITGATFDINGGLIMA